ncbi:hypothetical protein [Phytobacter diazotrophicus]|uniref:hypothetical protein n=1 Tax=Phytobacter diazotrophicus TaxID=395631 RepID=UPI002FF128FB
MPSKLKQRRLRRLKSDVAWWRDEANDWKEIALEHAAEIERLKGQVIHVVLPMMVPPAVIEGMKAKRVEHQLCLKCNDGARGGCSACAYNDR